MKKFRDKYCDGAPLWQVMLFGILVATPFLMILAKM